MKLTVGVLRRLSADLPADLPIDLALLAAPPEEPEDTPRAELARTDRFGWNHPADPTKPGSRLTLVGAFTAGQLILAASCLIAEGEEVLARAMRDAAKQAEYTEGDDWWEFLARQALAGVQRELAVSVAARRLVEAVQEAHEAQDDGSEEWNAGKAFEALQEAVAALMAAPVAEEGAELLEQFAYPSGA